MSNSNVIFLIIIILEGIVFFCQYKKLKKKYISNENIHKEIKGLLYQKQILIEEKIREEKEKNKIKYYTLNIPKEDLEDIDNILKNFKTVKNPNVVAKIIWELYLREKTKQLVQRITNGNKIMGIYKITNLSNGKCYIGRSVDVGNRITQHIKASVGFSSIAAQEIHKVILDCGLNNWSFELIKISENEIENKRDEKYFIEYYKSNVYGWNKNSGG